MHSGQLICSVRFRRKGNDVYLMSDEFSSVMVLYILSLLGPVRLVIHKSSVQSKIDWCC